MTRRCSPVWTWPVNRHYGRIWPLQGYRLGTAVGHDTEPTAMMVFKASRRGTYVFRGVRLAGTGYTRRNGKRVAVPFDQTFDLRWSFCVGNSEKKCHQDDPEDFWPF